MSAIAKLTATQGSEISHQLRRSLLLTAAIDVDNDYRRYSENSQTDIENIRSSNTI